MNCTDRYNSKDIQSLQNMAMRKWLDHIVKETGGLPANAQSEFKKGFKLGFVNSCKKRRRVKKTRKRN